MGKKLENEAVKDLKCLGTIMKMTKTVHYEMFDVLCKHCPDRRKVRNKNEYICKNSAIEDDMSEWECRLIDCPCM